MTLVLDVNYDFDSRSLYYLLRHINTMSELKIAKIDPVQIILTSAIFAVLFYTVYLMNTNLTFVSLAFAAFIMFYQLLSARGNLSSKFKNGKKQYVFYHKKSKLEIVPL